MNQLLFVEDDLNFAHVLEAFLKGKGFAVKHVSNGNDAIKWLKNNTAELCILDVMMPGMSGFELATEIRKISGTTPFIFLTAKNNKADIISGFGKGADDYMIKPFDPDILFLKINALLKRTPPAQHLSSADQFTIGGIQFNATTRELHMHDKITGLSPKETQLLRLFCEAPDGVVLRNHALREIWDTDNYFASRSMDVYIVKLKKKLKMDSRIQIINLYNNGFRLFISDTLPE